MLICKICGVERFDKTNRPNRTCVSCRNRKTTAANKKPHRVVYGSWDKGGS